VIEINLLSTGENRRGTRRRAGGVSLLAKGSTLGMDPWTLGLGATGVLVLLVAGWSHWSTSSAMSRLDTEIAQEVTDSTRYATTIALVSGLKARQDTIQQKIEVIRGVDTRRYIWPRIMDEVSRSVPAQAWLTKLSAAGADRTTERSPAFTIEGAAHSTQSLTGFMKNLEISPFIRDVTLVTTEQVASEGRVFNRFTLEARFEVPDAAYIETIPVVVVRN
jgi:Tfp pilus assembly protein PilN